MQKPIMAAAGIAVAVLACRVGAVAGDNEPIPANQPVDTPVGDTMLGSLGQWGSDLLGREPAALSYRNRRFDDIEA